ncbi:cupin domain-containing protein [Halostagnicola kamekurae]|uniref:Cupin domain-containing protein n=1 Tax=Halostagnicola kamekurae TaxID=619731 RepID=A0A1I6QJ12_9EURY|nr:cupin domain-containing protein [Halostagnicola kamekurae]SFS52300.1 Cupin domain-containing protein [Halostagnicola kamekurae]
MEKVEIDEVDNEPNPMAAQSVRRPVSDALGTTDFAMNYFELEPGESFSGGYHTHHDQEEVFYVLEGTATFETENGPLTVDAGELVRFAPGEFQQGTNEGDDPLVGWALGAPDSSHNWEDIESVVYCRACDSETKHGLEITDGGGFRLNCSNCDSSFTIA